MVALSSVVVAIGAASAANAVVVGADGHAVVVGADGRAVVVAVVSAVHNRAISESSGSDHSRSSPVVCSSSCCRVATYCSIGCFTTMQHTILATTTAHQTQQQQQQQNILHAPVHECAQHHLRTFILLQHSLRHNTTRAQIIAQLHRHLSHIHIPVLHHLR